MRDPKEILRLFESRMRELDMTQTDRGLKAFGKVDHTAMQSLEKSSSPGYDRVAAMAEALGLELYLGLPRPKGSGFAEPDAAADLSQPRLSEDHFMSLPLHGPSGGMASSPIALSSVWMAAHALLADRLHVIVPDAVNIEGFGQRGAVAGIDKRAERPVGVGLWCYAESGKSHIARLTFDRGTVIISPKRPEQPPRLILGADAARIRPLGKVVWLAYMPDQ